ncbi:MAG: ornithine carbamoyltransferase [bacterium]|nr:ornithine carbamoyltransferase [bacterium]
MSKRDLLSVTDLDVSDIWWIFELTDSILNKEQTGEVYLPLAKKSVGLIFQKPSTRTRISFEVGIQQLGGHSVFLRQDEIQFGQRESIEDIARTLSQYLDLLIARTYSHKDIELLAKFASIPVINALSDLFHPAQVLSDVYTIWKKKGKVKGLNLTYIGDGGNNISQSLLLISAMMGINITIATPPEYMPAEKIISLAEKISFNSGSLIKITHNPLESAYEADIIYTDVWTSMGQEEEERVREKIFAPYQVNTEVLNTAKNDSLVMHCLPAHRGQEITAEVLDSNHSIVFEQARNKLLVQKGILVFLNQ